MKYQKAINIIAFTYDQPKTKKIYSSKTKPMFF
ncbi:hypothetical protein O205_08715 [Bacillus amyloliquefaciens EGD-AQ14]|nr:hypothetical protein O205_08715 [Bacillus amyloliquefaciens EGD-AQ14]